MGLLSMIKGHEVSTIQYVGKKKGKTDVLFRPVSEGAGVAGAESEAESEGREG